MNRNEIEKIELDLLLEAVYRRSGYDFRHYSRASLFRRVDRFLKDEGFETPSEAIPRLLYDRPFLESLVAGIPVPVTELFRDPPAYRKIREEVIPYLKTFPFVKIWHAGCATGEGVYSMAILLTEESLYDRCQIYATDLNGRSLEAARRGIYPIGRMKRYIQNHHRSGGRLPLADFYRADADTVVMDSALKRNVVFSSHNLAGDHSFGEMHLIVCRNVLIYFDQTLQDRVLSLFHESLVPNGMLWLGTKESIQFSGVRNKFRNVAERERIFQWAG